MNAPQPAIIFIPVPLPVPVAGQIYSKRSSPPVYPAKPRPQHWPKRQSIPSPGAVQALEQARRLLAERRGRAVG
jgi:hypothetical protein